MPINILIKAQQIETHHQNNLITAGNA